jgi:membrane-associated phospholipid phosphatase
MKVLLLLLIICQTSSGFAFESLTGGKSFFPWIWQDQIRPTAVAAISLEQGFVVGGGAAATILSHQYDGDVREQFGRNRRMDASVSQIGSLVGSGGPGIAIALTQLLFDRQNGLQMTRALAFTSATAFTTANGSSLSFPSGHTSSAFATATSLAYSYGPWVGIPAFGLATFVGVTRIADDAHWISDTVSGAALGIFWARASAMANARSSTSSWMPVLVPGGMTLAYSSHF